MSTLRAEVQRHRFDTTEYHRMVEAGILSEDARVEFVDGEVVEMSPIGSAHQAVVDRLYRLLMSFAGEGYIVRTQGAGKARRAQRAAAGARAAPLPG